MPPTDPEALAHRATLAAKLQTAFFAGPNTFPHGGATADLEAQKVFTQSLQRHAQGNDDRPVMLPFTAGGGPTAWYVCVPTDAMARALHSELKAFLGPSFVEMQPRDRAEDAADRHALPLINAAGWLALRFNAATARIDDIVLRQWRTYWRLLDHRPRPASYVPKTFDQLRAAYDRALLARNEASALAAMSSLKERFGLSGENRKFLEIRLAAAFERWEEIAGHPLLAHLLNLDLPPETYGDVMEALYRVHVQPFEAAPRAKDLVAQFLETIAGTAHPMFRSRRRSRRPAVLKAFLLHELAQSHPQAVVCDALLRDLALGAFGSLDGAVRASVAALGGAGNLAEAQQALADERFDRAWELLLPLADSVEVIRGLVVCARECDDPVKVQALLARLEAADAPIRAAVESLSAGRLAKLRATAAPTALPAANASATWAVQLRRANGEPLERYVERWRELARSAEPAQLLAEDGLPAAAVECLTCQALEEPEVFERLYPLWHELFVDRVEPDPRLAPLYTALLETLRLRDVFSDTEQQLLHQTLVAVVRAGDDEDYRRAVDEVREVFETIRSPQAIGWALDVCDTLATLRTRNADARLRMLTCVVQACVEFSARLTPLQRELLTLLAREAHVELPTQAALPEAGPAAAPVDESALRIAFYSLDEGATRRAANLLLALHPRWQLETNADSVCTPKLKSLAQAADVFVFAWRSSKHAAYYCVKAAVGTKDNLVMARGVGTTSLISAVLERVSAS